MATAMKVPTIFTAVDRFSHVVDTMNRNVTSFGKAAEGASMRIGRKMDAVGKSMMATSAIMVASLAYPTNKALEFEDQIASIGTLLPNLDSKGLTKLGDEILAMANKTSTPIQELTKSYYDLISAGVEQQKAMSWLKSGNRLSIAGLGTLVESTNIELAAMRNFSNDFKTAEEAANSLFKTVKFGKTTVAQLSEAYAKNAVSAGNLGIKGQEFNALIAAMTTSTMPTAETENMIGNLAIALQKGKGKLSVIFSDLGVKNAEQLLKKAGSFENMINMMDKSAKKTGVSVNKMFPLKGASTAFTMLTKNKLIIDKYKESLNSIADKNEDALGVAYNLKMATGKFGIGKLKNNLDSVAITIGTTLIPAILDLTETLTPMLKEFRDWVKQNPGAITGFAKLAIAIGAIGAAFTVGGWLFRLYGFIASLPSITAIAQTLFSTITLWAGYAGISVAALLWEITLVVAAITALAWIVIDAVQHWSDWKEILLVLIGPIGWVTMLVRKLIQHASKIIDAFSFNGLIAGFKAIGNMLIDMVLTPLEKILNVMSRLPMIGDKFKGMSASVADYRSGFSETKAVGNLSGSSQFQNLGGAMPTWGAAENLAGKNKNQASMEKGGTLRVVIDDKTNKVKDVDDTNVYGIPVVLSGNQGNWGR